MEKLSDSMKKVLLAGIGAVAITAEKSQKMLEDMVKKGELTVEQGKVLNEELKHTVKSKVRREKPQEKTQEETKKDFGSVLDAMTPEELATLKEEILKKEAKAAKEAQETEEKAQEIAKDVLEDAKEKAQTIEQEVTAVVSGDDKDE